MNKLRVASAVSKIFAHTTWAAANVYRVCKKTGSKALAAYIGRKKYGKKKFQQLANLGKKRKKK